MYNLFHRYNLSFAISLLITAILDYTGGMCSFPSSGQRMFVATWYTIWHHLSWVLADLLCLLHWAALPSEAPSLA